MAWYRTGTISLSNGSTAVTGVGTAWIANAAVGEALYAPDGRLYEIVAVVSNTVLTLGSAYLGSNASGQSYVIVPSQSYIRDLAAQAAALVNNYSTIYNTVGQGKFQDGTVAAPGVTFNQDQDTGFYRSASNEVTFVANGVAQFKYGTGGVTFLNGINATSLTLSGNTTIGDASGDTLTVNATPTLAVNPTISSGTANGVAYLNGSKVLTTGSALTFDGNLTSPKYVATSAGNDRLLIEPQAAGSGTLLVGTNNAASAYAPLVLDGGGIRFNSSGSEQMRLTSTGLGIGTSSPATKLQIAGKGNGVTSNYNGEIYLGDTAAYQGRISYDGFTGTTALYIDNTYDNADAKIQFRMRTAGTPVTALTINGSGNLGLGVTPSAWGAGYKALDLNRGSLTAGSTSVGVFNNTFNNGTNWLYTYTGAASYYQQSEAHHRWYTAPSGTAGNAISFTQAMTLDSSGNLGLGVTPSAWLNVKAFQFGSASIYGTSSASETGYDLNAYYDGTSWKYINSSYATRYLQSNGQHTWQTAPSGTAGNAISFTQAMTLNASGNLGVGTSSPVAFGAGYVNAQVNGTTGSFLNLSVNGTRTGYMYADVNGVELGSLTNTYTRIITNNTERMRIDSSGNLLVGKISATANGGNIQTSDGITFPATQVALSDANTLDDYEEGTFTPTIVGTTTAGTGTYSSQIGRYTKVGNRVMYQAYVEWSAHTGTGDMHVGNLPFTSNAAANSNNAASLRINNIALTAGKYAMAFVASNSTIVYLNQYPTGGGSSATIPIDTSGGVMVSGHYEV